MNKQSCCSFTGHRSEKLPWKDETSKQAENFKMQLCVEICLKIKAGCDTFFTGMCNGVDIIAGEMIIELKELHPNIKLIAVIPYEEFPSNWSEEWRERYFDLVSKADKEVLLNNKYKPKCFIQRNQYLVDNAKHIIAVHNDGDYKSGTFQTVKMAKRKYRSIVIINPENLELERIESKPKFTLV